MPVIIQYEVDDDQAQRFFDYAGYRARSMRTPFSRVAGRIRSIMFEQFDTQGAVFPSAGQDQWAPLNPSYLEGKIEDGYDERIGRRTGEMRRQALHIQYGTDYVELSINHFNEEGEDIAEEFHSGRPNEVLVDSKGNPYMGGGQPARPLWETTEEFKDEVQMIFWMWLADLKRFNRRRAGLEVVMPGMHVSPTMMIDE